MTEPNPSPAEWWHPYLAKYVAHAGLAPAALANHHHFYAFMHALARKFPPTEEWADGGRDRRWFICPPEIGGVKCYLPGTEQHSIAWCSFSDALTDMADGWLTSDGLPCMIADSGGDHLQHDPIAELIAIAREAGEDESALIALIHRHAVASGSATTGSDSTMPRQPQRDISVDVALAGGRTSRRTQRRKPDATAETGNLFGAA